MAANDPLKILTFNAPSSFRLVLTQLGYDKNFVFVSDTWFEPETADVWVVFYSSKKNLVSLPKFVAKILEHLGDRDSALTRIDATLKDQQNLTVQLSSLSNSTQTFWYQGCLAALDIALLVDDRASVIEDLDVSVCESFKDS